MDGVGLSVAYFAIVLGLGVLLANLLKKKSVPDVFFLLLLGLFLGPTIFSHPAVAQYIHLILVDVAAMSIIPDFLRTLALIMIIFTGMFNLKFKVFKRFSDVSIRIGVIGVVFNTIVLGFIAAYMFNMAPMYALLMAASISGTGASVILVLKDSLPKESGKPFNVLKIESVLNSPISVLIPLLFLDLILIAPGTIIEPLKYAGTFWQMIVAGIGTGMIIGYGISKVIKGMLKEYSPLLFFSVALLTYALAEAVGGSGVLAVAVCGLIAGNMILKNREEISEFDDNVSEMLRISIFVLLGAQVFLTVGLNEFLGIFIFFIIVFLVRPLFLIPSLGRMKAKFCRKELLFMSFTAPRGIASAAMIPIISATVVASGSGTSIANDMMNIAFIVILLSILFSTIAAKIFTSDKWLKGPRWEEPVGREEAARKLKKSKHNEVIGKKKNEDTKESIEAKPANKGGF
jgi:cell volume regulation protein A